MMSERERWIVYPLLFLAVFLGWRNQMPRSGDLDCQSIRCQRLLVTSPDGERSVEIASSAAQSGELRLFGADGRVALILRTDRTGNRGMLETRGSDRTAQTLIGSNSHGGFLKLFGNQDVPSLFLGHEGRLEVSGLLALSKKNRPFYVAHENGHYLWGLPLPWSQNEKLSDLSDTTDDETADEAVPPAEDRAGEDVPASSTAPAGQESNEHDQNRQPVVKDRAPPVGDATETDEEQEEPAVSPTRPDHSGQAGSVSEP